MSGASPTPATPFVASARAPGKCIVFGEHGVVHGTPELLFAIDLETNVTVRSADHFSLNGDREARQSHSYFQRAVELLWREGPPLEVRATSRIPRSAGLGSSAAFVAAMGVALTRSAAGSDEERARLAELSFRIEHGAQGVGSPGDTSTVVAGGFVTINADRGEPLWTVRDGERAWTARRATDPGWSWVVAYSGIPRSTAEAVRAVRERLARPDGEELLGRFRDIAQRGMAAIEGEDRDAAGGAMTENHLLLREVGVSHPRLEELITSVEGLCDGAKLTGAGAGGSVLVLPRPGQETACVRRLARAGALAFAVRASSKGASPLNAANAIV